MKKIIGLEHKDPYFDNQVKIEWHLGLYCNKNCSYCSDTSHDNIPNHLSFSTFQVGISNLLQQIDKERIRIEFTGGEPTLNPNFYRMLEYLSEVEIDKTSFTTNGVRSLTYYKKCIDLIDSVTFSFHMEYENIDPNTIIELQKYIDSKKRKRWLKVHIMFLPTTSERVKSLKDKFEKNDIRYAIRRIRPSYHRNHPCNEYWSDGRLKKGTIVHPFDTDSISALLCTEESGTDHSGGDEDYYSKEELEILERENRFNFENLIIHYSDRTIENSNVNRVTGDKLNQFKGWKCWAGIQSMRIGVDGTITVGKCEIPPLGNVFSNFKIPDGPSICKNDWCCSATNINTTKLKQNCNVRVNNERL